VPPIISIRPEESAREERLRRKQGRVTLDHGGGGRASRELVQSYFLPSFNNPFLGKLDDSAVVDFPPGRLAITTDCYVVDPIFFPGGDIGMLAVNGTVNDLSAQGAQPLFLSAAFILEEGFELAALERILISMATASREANVSIIAGDTKVVPKGKGDKIYINTTGVGLVQDDVDSSGSNAKLLDKVILSGPIGDHGIAVLSQREGLAFDTDLRSDSAPLNQMVEEILSITREIHVMRDPTRGGVAASLNEIAAQSGVGIVLTEAAIPVKEEVKSACEILGLDPLYVANEGKLLVFVPPEHASRVLERVRQNQYGRDARIIGEVVADHPGRVVMKTRTGGKRIIDMPLGEQLPRIC
jgi:hydrogenase expression/formation protein HypE